MRIAQIAPLFEAVPPRLYGGTERVISWLTEALVEEGHEVTLFATGDSVTSAKLEAVWPRSLRLDGCVSNPDALHIMMLEQVVRRASEFDLLHFHLDYYPFSLFSRQSTPFMTTLHGRLDLPELCRAFETFPTVPVVSVSHAQRAPLPCLNWIGTVLHGLPHDLLKPEPMTRSYLAFLGRISPEKGVDAAIEIACRCGIPLKIAAKVDKNDADYFETVIRPLLKNKNVEYIGEIRDAEKSSFLSGALALLMPIRWPEPFGIVMIEAMACGTPVIGCKRGSIPEVIDAGVTGYAVNGVEEAVQAIHRLGELSHAAVRRRFEERFTTERMTEDYLKIYRNLVLPRTKLNAFKQDRQVVRQPSAYSVPETNDFA
jgi:glycosyltransferase involved in cell wall biosynthesis